MFPPPFRRLLGAAPFGVLLGLLLCTAVHAAPPPAAGVADDVPAWAKQLRRERAWAAEVRRAEGQAPPPAAAARPAAATSTRAFRAAVVQQLRDAQRPVDLTPQEDAPRAQAIRRLQIRAIRRRLQQNQEDSRLQQRRQEQHDHDGRQEQLQQERRAYDNRQEDLRQERRRQEMRQQENRQEQIRQENRRQEIAQEQRREEERRQRR